METKIKKYRDISSRERDDIEYMRNMKKLYMENLADYSDDADYRKIDNIVFQFDSDIEKAEQVAIEKAEKAELEEIKRLELLDNDEKRKQKKAENLQSKVTNKLIDAKINEDKMEKLVGIYSAILKESEIYFVAEDNKIHEYYNDLNSWETRSLCAHYTHSGIQDLPVKQAYEMALVKCGHNKTNITYSFNYQPERVLNKLSKKHWLEPDYQGDGAYSNVFDIILLALSNGRDDIMNHIEQVVYWKYKHPDDYTIPCLSIYGDGGLGKNTFVQYVLGGIFGQDQVTTIGFDDLKDFSGLIQGKTFVFLDEMITDDNASKRLKQLCGNPRVAINNKNGTQKIADSTAAWITGGNDKMGSFLLTGHDADRRWSIIKSNKNVKYWTKALLELETDDEIKDAMVANLEVLKDVKEVAKWLGYICNKHKNMKSTPDAYHNEDYNKLISVQKNAFEDFMGSVFSDESFTWIKTSTLFKSYKLFVGEFYEGQKRWLKGRTKFFAEVEEWITDNEMSIEKRKITYNNDGNEHRVWTFKNECLTKVDQNTDVIYLTFDKFGNIKLNIERFYPDNDVDSSSNKNVLDFPKND